MIIFFGTKGVRFIEIPLSDQYWLNFFHHKVITDPIIEVKKSSQIATFVNVASMENRFSVPTIYIGFCHYQLHKYGSYQPCKAGLRKVENEFLLNLDIAMKKKLVLY